jgi:phosphatidylglycerophosphatase A
MTLDTEPSASAAALPKKPHISFLVATWFGLGYLPKAPGTWGSIGGLAVVLLIVDSRPFVRLFVDDIYLHGHRFPVYGVAMALCCLLFACVGVWSSSTAAAFSGKKDPQFIVIDEVSGQMLTLFLGASAAFPLDGVMHLRHGLGFLLIVQAPIALVGFLLFRLFDIWKPFPIRRLEKLPGGWGIMADDWMAGIYAAILLRLALHFNLL